MPLFLTASSLSRCRRIVLLSTLRSTALCQLMGKVFGVVVSEVHLGYVWVETKTLLPRRNIYRMEMRVEGEQI